MITTQKYSSSGTEDIYSVTLDNGKGLSAEILNIGCAIKKLNFKGTDVVLGFDTYEGYLNNTSSFGVAVGRVANRIANSEFEIDNIKYTVTKNEGNNNLHSAGSNVGKKIWQINPIDNDEPTLELTYTTPDGEDGFPGNVTIKVTYTLTKENSIKIHYEATTDKDTIVNMTNHSYFNLNGHNSGNVYNHKLYLNSKFYTPSDAELIPTGEICSVADTPYDFTAAKLLGSAIKSDFKSVAECNGLDTNFCIDGRGYCKAAVLTGDISGITMEVYTDSPGIQIYTTNGTKERDDYKEGANYCVHSAVCLETQNYPNAINIPHFPSPILRCGEKYDTTTEYRFI